MTDAEGLGVKLEDRETVIKEVKKSLKIKVTPPKKTLNISLQSDFIQVCLRYEKDYQTDVSVPLSPPG